MMKMSKPKTKTEPGQRLLTVREAEAAAQEAERGLVAKYMGTFLREVDTLILKHGMKRYVEVHMIKSRGFTPQEWEILVELGADNLEKRGFDVLIEDDEPPFLVITWKRGKKA